MLPNFSAKFLPCHSEQQPQFARNFRLSPDEGRGMNKDVRNNINVTEDGVDKQLAIDMPGNVIMVPQMHTAIRIES